MSEENITKINEENHFKDTIIQYVSIIDAMEDKTKKNKENQRQYTEEMKMIRKQKKELESEILEIMNNRKLN